MSIVPPWRNIIRSQAAEESTLILVRNFEGERERVYIGD